MANRWGKSGNSGRFYFWGVPESLWKVTAATKYKGRLLLGRKSMTNIDSMLKERHHFADKDPYSQSWGFSSSHVQMWELNHKEGWVPINWCFPKNWCFQTVALEKTLESPLDFKEIKSVNPTGNQSWIFIGRTDVETETPILWPPHAKNWLIGKGPDAGKDWRREEKGMREGDDRGWMASLTWWTWVWASSRSWWWTGKPGVLQFMELRRAGHDWVNELNWTDTPIKLSVQSK